MSSVDQMNRDNEQLVKDLKITLKLLEAFRTCLIDYTKNCKCDVNQRNGDKFDKLDTFLNAVTKRIELNKTIVDNREQNNLEHNDQHNSETPDKDNPLTNG